MNGFTVTQFEELIATRPATPLHPGVDAWPLEVAPESGLPARAFVRFAPGHGYPIDDHHTDSRELVLVLAGLLADEAGQYGPLTQIEAAVGTRHRPYSPAGSEGAFVHVSFPDRR